MLCKWNTELAKKGKKVLLVLDNASTHKFAEYSNIELLFLPPRVTSKIQPLDQGILRSVKCKYRKKLAHLYLHSVENKETAKDIMQSIFKRAVDMIADCWD